ncbi:antibiotic biosynthesis monooxygenase family protein [Xinfangfangia pollutisoli]|uniref:antibiotic biosynthesis monooxygenase family protein n=1 Tax=Xinfangfangia pollutisoli TaxID=2865960 RepID=UPI001CD69B6D|nr:antibiotic biosynthesis monooxygenase [Xinfangfangia pollutisoli]
MYLTMNRFKVKAGEEAAFEEMWKSRDSHLPEVPGFVSFHLFKGPEANGERLYASHTMWVSEDAFKDWTRSEAFRAAHRGAGGHQGVILGHPQLEVFEAVQTITAPAVPA